MNNNPCVLKNSIICVILILLVGVCITPSINGYTEKTNNHIINKNSINLLSNNNYVNGHWKFDECNGNITYDSSENGYNGTIHGATWVSSGSGCALDFDGINDYVNLSDYAKNYLGFNKTDDLIFSFYFISSTTDKGIIYSTCRGGDYGYNPGFQIALKSDGRIEVQVWRLNCGILMNSTGIYNDDSLHFTEIFYNGITANPIVDIYVDNQIDTSLEHWVCNFYADQFQYAEIGRNSYEITDYYYGWIDEFKITKYPGGNEQNPPIIDGPVHGLPTVEYNYSFITNDPEEDNISLIIDWDDGNIEELNGSYQSGEEIFVSHTWEKEGAYNITARSKDRWHQSRWSEPYGILIGNQPPNSTKIEGPKYGDAGEELTYTFVSEDPEGHTIQFFIDWGDTNTEWTSFYMSGAEANITHIWDTNGNYIITAYAKDDQEDDGPWSEPYSIRIGNNPPNSPIIDGPTEGYPEERYRFTFISVDTEGDYIKYEIKWGDGTEEETDFYASGETVTIHHGWPVSGNYTITARACDTFGACSNWSEYTFKVPRCKSLNFNIIEKLLLRFPNTIQTFNYLLKIYTKLMS